jgi:putative dehydrogenase
MATPVVAVIAPGAMGAAVGKRLFDNGVKVLTSLQDRSQETIARAKAAGMAAASDKEIAGADFILSILPPGDALALAQRFAPALTASNSKPVYVDCNAINPKTVERVAAAIAPTECPFVDAGIIGQPPKPAEAGESKVAGSPRFYASGPAASRFAALRDFGLDVRVLAGAMSAASALKMSYAGITKGTQAIGAAMMLAASRAGSADDLFAELQSSQKELFHWLKRQLGMMPPKAYRWVAEMQEIAGFVGDDSTAHELYEGAAHFYEKFAEDFENGDKKDASALAAFLGKSGDKPATG